MKYKVLNQRNPEYHLARWRELDDLYIGGYHLRDKARDYLPRLLNEREETYEERIRLSSYINYVSMVVDFFTANLFSQELVVQPASDQADKDTLGTEPYPDKFYEIFSADADRNGNSFAKIMRGVFLSAILKKRALIAVDFPSTQDLGVIPINRAEEEKLGADRGYIYEIPIEEMIDWKTVEGYEEFEWCILKRTLTDRSVNSEERNNIYDEFRVWQKKDGEVSCTIYRTPMRDPGEKIDEDMDLTGESIDIRGFKKIPIIAMEMPNGLFVGGKIGLLAKEHYQTRSALRAAENKSLVAIPFVNLASEASAPGEAPPSEAGQNPHRGKDPVGQFKARGFLILGEHDKVGFAEPAGNSYELVERQLEKLVDEMFRIVHQMAASVTQTKVGIYRSAASKMQDRFTTEIVLAAYGSYVKDVSRKIYQVLSDARGENVVWNPLGLDKYDLEDRMTLIQEAAQMQMLNIPSKTFRKEYESRLATGLLGNIPPETQKVIKEELEAAVDAEGELRDVLALPMVNPPPEADGKHPEKDDYTPGTGSGKKIPKRNGKGQVVGSTSVAK